MTLKPIEVKIAEYPAEIQPLLIDIKAYDSSCSTGARVIFIEKDCGYFLKSAPKGTLERQAIRTKYFHGKGLSSKVLAYVSEEQDWLLTEKIAGDDCITAKYLEQPTRLCDILAERLALLHSVDFSDCPVMNHTQRFLARAEYNMRHDLYNKSHFPDSFGYKSADEAWAVVKAHSGVLQGNELLHGDYCLPNVMLDDWRFTGFIDLDHGGVGDRHVDLFWGLWSLGYNLKTDKYRQRFIDAYGREKVSEEILKVVAAVEVFG